MRSVRAFALAVAVWVGTACATVRPVPVASLKVECNVAAALLWIDDGFAGRVSDWMRGSHQLPVGFHRIEVRHPSYFSHFAEVELSAGGAGTVTAHLHPLLD